MRTNNMKKNPFVLSIILGIYFTLSPSLPTETKHFLFLNLLYRAIERSESTLDYFESFVKYAESNLKLHHNIISRMKNPTKNRTTEELHLTLNIHYNNYYQKTQRLIESYQQFRLILNNLYDSLTSQEKNEYQSTKEKTSIKIIKEIFTLKNIMKSIENIHIEFKLQDKKFLGSMKEKISHIGTLVSEKMHIYKYIVSIYNEFDTNLIQYDQYLDNATLFFYKEYKKISYIIEKNRRDGLVSLYNRKMNEYLTLYNTYPPKIIYINENEYIVDREELLPSSYNNSQYE